MLSSVDWDETLRDAGSAHPRGEVHVFEVVLQCRDSAEVLDDVLLGNVADVPSNCDSPKCLNLLDVNVYKIYLSWVMSTNILPREISKTPSTRPSRPVAPADPVDVIALARASAEKNRELLERLAKK